MIDAIATICRVEIEYRLRIAAGLELVPAGCKVIAIVGVVVDLTVICDAQRSIRIPHRLGPVSDIDNAQTTVSKTDISVCPHTSAVRAAMMQNVAHRDQSCFIYLSSGVGRVCDAVDTAHTYLKSRKRPYFAEFGGRMGQ